VYLSSTLVGLVPPESTTYRFHEPAIAKPPVVAVISVGETTTTSEAGIAVDPTPLPCPISTLAPATKFVPTILICVPPFTVPDAGATAVTIWMRSLCS